MIKVGQVYNCQNELIYVITKQYPFREENGEIGKRYQAIFDDGYVCEKLHIEEILKDKLIAEYPTWQEAVNSKEFKGE
jgi:hypothetical protein